jgi:pimeloyl-ACP methyl ester carboxylesterase
VISTIALALGTLLLLLTILTGLVWIFQERIAFQPPLAPLLRGIQAVPDDVSQNSYLAQDNQPLLAYVVGNPETAKSLLLCFHGNADLALNGVDWARKVAQSTGFAVMLAEYRGYMNLGGQPSYSSSQTDSEAAFSHARDSLQFSPSHIALYGHSLGTAVAAELATRHRPLCLILESPFTSARDMARIIAWRGIEIVWSTISRFHFDTITAVASLDAPVWVAHGMRDRLIPYAMGEQVFAAAKVKGRLLLVPDATHNDVADAGGIEYWRWLQAALC